MNGKLLLVTALIFLLGAMSMSFAQEAVNIAMACNSLMWSANVIGEYHCTVPVGKNISLDLFTINVQSVSPYPVNTTQGSATLNIYYDREHFNSSSFTEGDIEYYPFNGTQYQVVYYGANTLNSSIKVSIIGTKIITSTSTISVSSTTTSTISTTSSTSSSSVSSTIPSSTSAPTSSTSTTIEQKVTVTASPNILTEIEGWLKSIFKL